MRAERFKTQGCCTLFHTALGVCGIAWTPDGVTYVQLPEESRQATAQRIKAASHAALVPMPPQWVSRAIRGIQKLIETGTAELSGIPLDLSRAPEFHRQVYEEVKNIQPGRTATYRDVAAMAGSPRASRAVGQALARNPVPLIVPCHRVLAIRGKGGGFSAFGGFETKRRLLEIEGVKICQQSLFAGAGNLPFDQKKAMRHLCRADADLARLMERVGPFKLQLESSHDLFATLCEAIVYQQLTAKAAQAVLSRFVSLFPGRRFPGPRQALGMPDERLRAAGLSAAKARAIKDLSARAFAGFLPSMREIAAMDDEHVVEKLTTIRGIGRWTVQMLLIFKLGRPDVLPCHDLGIRKGFAVAFGLPELPSPAEVAARGEGWRPYRTVASWYLWRAAELHI